MDRYNVTGMSCAACQAHVEKAVSKVPGVESVSVSLLTNSMGVEGNADAEDIIKIPPETRSPEQVYWRRRKRRSRTRRAPCSGGD